MFPTTLDRLVDPGTWTVLAEYRGSRYLLGTYERVGEEREIAAPYLGKPGVYCYLADRTGSTSINGLAEHLDAELAA